MRVILIDENQDALEELTRHIRETQPLADIAVFPSEEALERWLEEDRPARLRVQTFGNFEVFWKEQPVRFERSKTRELFAYLIDRRGARSTMASLCPFCGRAALIRPASAASFAASSRTCGPPFGLWGQRKWWSRAGTTLPWTRPGWTVTTIAIWPERRPPVLPSGGST